MPHIPEKIHELTVGQLSARSGAAVSALHFYESKGLISSRRTSGNQRRYTRDALRRVAFVRAAQRVGIPLATIRGALAELPDERTPNREDWARLSAAWRSELDGRIAQLARLRDHLTDCIGCGCLSLENCVLSNPDDMFGDRMTGSRLLPVLPVRLRRAGPADGHAGCIGPGSQAADARGECRALLARASAVGVRTGCGTRIPQWLQTGPDHGSRPPREVQVMVFSVHTGQAPAGSALRAEISRCRTSARGRDGCTAGSPHQATPQPPQVRRCQSSKVPGRRIPSCFSRLRRSANSAS